MLFLLFCSSVFCAAEGDLIPHGSGLPVKGAVQIERWQSGSDSGTPRLTGSESSSGGTPNVSPQQSPEPKPRTLCLDSFPTFFRLDFRGRVPLEDIKKRAERAEEMARCSDALLDSVLDGINV